MTRDYRLDRSALMLAPPSGVDQIIASFGDIHNYVQPDGTLDPRWQTEFMDHVALPFPLLLSWDHSKSVRQFACHKRLTAIIGNVFANILAEGLQPKVKTFGGCFAFRPERTSVKLSTHSWGIAIDLNPETNLQGSAGDMDAGIIELFRDAGFEWGGEWRLERRASRSDAFPVLYRILDLFIGWNKGQFSVASSWFLVDAVNCSRGRI